LALVLEEEEEEGKGIICVYKRCHSQLLFMQQQGLSKCNRKPLMRRDVVEKQKSSELYRASNDVLFDVAT